MAYSSVLLSEDENNRPGDFSHEHFANYLKFVLQKNVMFIIHVLQKNFDRPTLENPHLAP